MRLLLLLALAALAGCAPGSVDPAAPAAPSAVDTAPAAVEEAAPSLNAAPAAVVHGTWIAPGATVIVSEEGVGEVVAGAVAFQPFTVTTRADEELVLTAADGTEYRFALGESPRLALSSRPDLTLTRR